MIRAVQELVLIFYYLGSDIINKISSALGGGMSSSTAWPQASGCWASFRGLTLETRHAVSSTRAYFTFFLVAGFLYLMVTFCSEVVFGRIEQWARRGQPAFAGGGR